MSRFSNARPLWLILIGFVLVTVHIRTQGTGEYELGTIRRSPLANPKIVELTSMDLDMMVSSMQWLDSLLVYGDRELRRDLQSEDVRWLWTSLLSQLYLDPFSIDTYVLSAGVFPFKGHPEYALQFALHGATKRTQDWRIFVSLGYLFFFQYGRKDLARKAWEYASSLSGSPMWLPGLAAAIYVDEGDLEGAKLLLNSIESREHQGREKFGAEWRRMKEAIGGIEYLDSVLEQYIDRFGRPDSLQDLVAAGVLRYVPLDPWGTSYSLDARRTKIRRPKQLLPRSDSENNAGKQIPEVWFDRKVAGDLLSPKWGID